MLPFKLVYHEGYFLPLGAHVFPAQKYRLIHRYLLESGIAGPADFITPEPGSDEDILLVHTPDYVRKLKTGTLSLQEEMQMEVPYSQQLVDAFWLAAGGSILAAQRAMKDGVSVNIGGGFHHAFPDHGEGFCVIHDVAVAIKRLHKDGLLQRAMTVDCDVHDGNGTAAVFPPKISPPKISPPKTSPPSARAGQPLPSAGGVQHDLRAANPPGRDNTGELEVFTISLHQENNYPRFKPPSSIDVNLPDGTNDEQYLGWLSQALSSAFRQFEPQMLFYIAGADPYVEDQLGGLALTIDGLRKRDDLVLAAARSRNIPVMITFAGGYARRTEDTVTIHCNTVLAAAAAFAGF